MALLLLRTVNRLAHSYDTSVFLHCVLLAKHRQRSERRFKVSTIILNIIIRQIFQKVHRQYFILRTFLLKSAASFFILHLKVLCYLFWVSDTDLKHITGGRIF